MNAGAGPVPAMTRETQVKQSILMVCVLVCAGLLFCARSANAGVEVDSVIPGDFDLKVSFGSSCDASNRNIVSISRNGLISNNSTTNAVDVICTLQRDRFTGGAVIATSGVLVFRANGALAMPCYILSVSSGGAVTTTTIQVTTKGSQSQVNFPSVSGAVTMGCRLPPKVAAGSSSLNAYFYFEL
jgi:hypothetical protein